MLESRFSRDVRGSVARVRPRLTLSGTGAVVASSSATGWSPLRSSLTSSTIFGCAFPGCALRFFQAELSPRFALTAVRLPAGTGRPTKVRSNVRRDLSGWILTERACVDAPPRLCPRRASEAALTGPDRSSGEISEGYSMIRFHREPSVEKRCLIGSYHGADQIHSSY